MTNLTSEPPPISYVRAVIRVQSNSEDFWLHFWEIDITRLKAHTVTLGYLLHTLLGIKPAHYINFKIAGPLLQCKKSVGLYMKFKGVELRYSH